MGFESRYKAKKPDSSGFVSYDKVENEVWEFLYSRQLKLIQGRASSDFIAGLQALHLPPDAVPQLPDCNQHLMSASGWSVSPVAALISAEDFFKLLANRHFPAATFIRTKAEIDYVKEPDIFHELFGHCPMLVNPEFGDFVSQYAKFVLTMPEKDWPLLQRLFWFTVEFGLINTSEGLRAYGGGILSSANETVYAIESDVPERRPFDPLTVFRTPYRIDMLQTVYYVIDDYQELYDFLDSDIAGILQQAYTLGEFEPTFPVDENNPNIHIHCC